MLQSLYYKYTCSLCHTARTWCPRSVTLRGHGVRAVSHCADITWKNGWNVRAVWHCADTVYSQCHTARTRCPRSVTLRGHFNTFFLVLKNSSGLSLQHIDKMLIALRTTMVYLCSKNIRIKFGLKNFWCPRSVTLRGHEKNAYNSKNT